MDITARLSLEPGTVVQGKAGSGLRKIGSRSRLVAPGTASQAIVLHSESSQKGGWRVISFENSSKPLNEQVCSDIRDGGGAALAGGSRANGVVDRSARLLLKNVKPENSAGCGYSISTSSSPPALVTASGLTFSENSGENACTF